MTEDVNVSTPTLSEPKKRTPLVKENTTATNNTTGEYAIQISTKLNGDLFNLRADSAEEFERQIDELASRGIAKKWSDFKQAAVAEIIFTNDDGRKLPAKTTSSATDVSPTTNTGGPPSCSHGVMNDTAGKGYKNRYYCPVDTRGMSPGEAKNAKCAPQN